MNMKKTIITTATEAAYESAGEFAAVLRQRGTFALFVEVDENADCPLIDYRAEGIELITFSDTWSAIADRNDAEEAEARLNGDDYIAIKVYRYDHGGSTVSTRPFSCKWDSGLWAVLSLPRENADNYGGPERAMAALEAVVKDLAAWMEGEIYGYVVERDGEAVDSCWGFIGDRELAVEEGAAVLRAHIRDEAERLRRACAAWSEIEAAATAA